MPALAQVLGANGLVPIEADLMSAPKRDNIICILDDELREELKRMSLEDSVQ